MKVWYKHSPYPWVSWQACFSPKYLFQTNQHGEDVFFHIFQDYSQKGNVETKQESSITCSRPGIIAIWTHSRIQILSTPPPPEAGMVSKLNWWPVCKNRQAELYQCPQPRMSCLTRWTMKDLLLVQYNRPYPVGIQWSSSLETNRALDFLWISKPECYDG